MFDGPPRRHPPRGLYTIYVLQWPSGFFKVGYTTRPDRYGRMVGRGAEIRMLIEFDNGLKALDLERRLHQFAMVHHMPAFESRADAVTHLGQRGCGWTECYLGSADRVMAIAEHG